MVRVKDKGDLYVHQDANWNVIGLTDLGRHVVERYVYTPYGELLVNQETSFGDRDGDNDVDASDRSIAGAPSPATGAWRVNDLNFDGTVDSSDQTLFDALPQGLARHPGRTFSGVYQPFAHQGLLFEPEIGSYQNRARGYVAEKRRFLQWDPLFSKNSRLGREGGPNAFLYQLANSLRYLDHNGMTIDRAVITPCSIELYYNIAFWGSGSDQYRDVLDDMAMGWNSGGTVKVGSPPRGDKKTVAFHFQGMRYTDPYCDTLLSSDSPGDIYGGICVDRATRNLSNGNSAWLRDEPIGSALGAAHTGGNRMWAEIKSLAFGTRTFAHEIGHIMGGHHNDCGGTSGIMVSGPTADELFAGLRYPATCCNVRNVVVREGVVSTAYCPGE